MLWGVIGRDETLTPFAIFAIVVAVCGVILASREQDKAETTGVDAATHRRSILLAIVAAIGFGTIFTLIAEAGEESIYWPAAVLKTTTLGAVVLIVVLAGSRRSTWGARPRGRGWLFPISIGFFDVTANITFAAAAQEGKLAITSVVSSLYPVITVMLAFVFLHERLGDEPAGRRGDGAAWRCDAGCGVAARAPAAPRRAGTSQFATDLSDPVRQVPRKLRTSRRSDRRGPRWRRRPGRRWARR